jgi:hypothetical protein
MKGYELFAGAKLFGYLKAGRPIIGVVPADETARILHRVGVMTVADAGSVPKIVSVIQLVLDAWQNGTLRDLGPDPRKCEAYSAERHTAALELALEGRPPAEWFVPHAVEVPRSLSAEILGDTWSKTWRTVKP